MNQELCDIKENQGNEICKLLRSLAKNREKLSNDIKGIYKDLDTMTKDNQNVTCKMMIDNRMITRAASLAVHNRGFLKSLNFTTLRSISLSIN